jgi:hypothetical protein
MSVQSSISKSANAVEVWKGQSKDLEVSVTEEVVENGVKKDVPFSLAGATVYFAVKHRTADPQALIRKSSASVSEIEITSPATDGKAMIHIVPTDTSLLDADTYVFDVWVQLASGKRYPVIEVSEFLVKEPVTVIG